MKRKLIQLGASSLMVSLPANVVQSFHLKKGDEVDVVTKHNIISIVTNTSSIAAKIEKTISLLANDNLLNRKITASYRSGVDVLHITLNNQDQVKQIKNCLANETIGMEIMRVSQNTCTIEDISGQNTPFEKLFSRLLYMILDLKETTTKTLTSEEYKLMDRPINKFCNVCIRVLHKKNHPYKQQYYHIIRQLERYADAQNNTAINVYKSILKSLLSLETQDLSQALKLAKKHKNTLLKSIISPALEIALN